MGSKIDKGTLITAARDNLTKIRRTNTASLKSRITKFLLDMLNRTTLNSDQQTLFDRLLGHLLNQKPSKDLFLKDFEDFILSLMTTNESTHMNESDWNVLKKAIRKQGEYVYKDILIMI